MESCPTTAYAVANWFLDRANAEGMHITHMKLQKLVYLAYGWYYAYYERPLFPEGIYAWTHGPVIVALYGIFKDCGDRAIDYYASAYSDENDDGILKEKRYSIQDSCDKENIENVVAVVWNDYSHLTAGQLRNLTHRPDTPWGKLYTQFNGKIKNAIIEPKEIRKYFDTLIQRYSC